MYSLALIGIGLGVQGKWNPPHLRTCNPLGDGKKEDCLLPFPSSYYTKKDPSTATGLRLNLAGAILPISRFGTLLDPTLYNHRDGFSNVATLLAYFPSSIGTSSLPDSEHVEVSLTPKSSVQLIRYDTGERVPLFAELDANANPHLDKQGLLIQPTVRLHPKSRYIALIQDLRDREGKLIEPLSGFKQLKENQVPPGSTLEKEKAKFDEIFTFLEKQGIKRTHLQLAWDFVTGSDDAVVGRMVQMKDQADAETQRSLDHNREDLIQIQKVEDYPPLKSETLLRRIQGTFKSPSFLVRGNGNRLNLDTKGDPQLVGDTAFPFTIHIPACARNSKTPLPVMLYGHGTFNSAENEMNSPYETDLINRLCMIQIGTDWLGRAHSDLNYFLFKILPNWNNFAQITDRLQQAHINFAVLSKLIRSGALNQLPSLTQNGQPLIDTQQLYYFGISEGGCQGVTLMALSSQIERGAMNVPCGFWSMFFWRSSDFYYTRHALNFTYPGALERQKLLVLSQLLWDYTDPANYGEHLLRNPLPGSQVKKILYQEGINDASVPNLTTRAMARTIGLSLLEPKVEKVDGIPSAAGPLDSAYVQYSVGFTSRLGRDNIPPAKSSVHEEIRRLPAAQEQLKRFLKADGKIEDSTTRAQF